MLLDFSLGVNFIELKIKDKEHLKSLISSEEAKVMTLSNETSTQSDDLSTNIGLFNLKDCKYKISSSTLEILNFYYDTFKVIIYFDISLSETIIQQFVKLIKMYLNYCKEVIIEGEGVKKNKLKSISQKEISLLYANISLIETIVLHFIQNFSSDLMQESNLEIIIPSLNSILSTIQKIRQSCKDKIRELFFSM